MKRFFCLISITFFFGIIIINPAHAKSPTLKKPGIAKTHKLAGGVRWHANYPGFDNMPVEDGDMSYLLMYEYHETYAFWQLGASYAPEPSDGRFEYILTPQLNLIFKDRIFRLGGGLQSSKVKTDTDSDWTDIFWQFTFGLAIPLGSHMGIDLYGHYVFENWGNIFDSDHSGLEYSAMLSVAF